MGRTQERLLSAVGEQKRLPPEGEISSGIGSPITPLTLETFAREVHPATAGEGQEQTLRIALLDGPAGVGKTSLISKLAYDRAKS